MPLLTPRDEDAQRFEILVETILHFVQYCTIAVHTTISMASTIAIGLGIAAAAFLVRFNFTTLSPFKNPSNNPSSQGRAGLVALRRYRGGVSALGRAYYKGGFESHMNRREAALILELPYVFHLDPPFSH
jgi:hypothetical protein